jgi:hypothetical protein
MLHGRVDELQDSETVNGDMRKGMKRRMNYFRMKGDWVKPARRQLANPSESSDPGREGPWRVGRLRAKRSGALVRAQPDRQRRPYTYVAKEHNLRAVAGQELRSVCRTFVRNASRDHMWSLLTVIDGQFAFSRSLTIGHL